MPREQRDSSLSPANVGQALQTENGCLDRPIVSARAPVFINGRFLSQELTGVQRFARELVRELRRERPDLRVLAPPDAQAELCEEFAAKRVGRHVGQLWEQVDLPRYLARQGSPLLLNLGNTAPLLWRRSVVTLHDVTYVRFPGSYSRRFLWWYGFLVPRILRRGAHVITVSEFSKKEIVDLYRIPAAKITVVPNAVRMPPQGEARHPRRDGKPYFLAVSSPVLHKNFAAMIEAYLTLPFRRDVDMKIVGSAAAAMKQAERTPGAGVDFLGRVDDEALTRLYRGAIAFVFPSLYEGFGLPPLEAQANGCPVISSDAASMPEVLRDSARYFDAGKLSEIAAAMSEIYGSAHLREQLVTRGFENVRRFSWADSARKVLEILALPA